MGACVPMCARTNCSVPMPQSGGVPRAALLLFPPACPPATRWHARVTGTRLQPRIHCARSHFARKHRRQLDTVRRRAGVCLSGLRSVITHPCTVFSRPRACVQPRGDTSCVTPIRAVRTPRLGGAGGYKAQRRCNKRGHPVGHPARAWAAAWASASVASSREAAWQFSGAAALPSHRYWRCGDGATRPVQVTRLTSRRPASAAATALDATAVPAPAQQQDGSCKWQR